MTIHVQFFPLEWNDVMALWLMRVACHRHSKSGNMGSIPATSWNSLQPLSNLRGSEPVSGLTQALLYWISPVQIMCWQSFLNMNIWLPLFWSTWSRTSSARGQDSATLLALCMGSDLDYSNCIASEHFTSICSQKAWPLIFPELLKILKNPSPA